MTVAGPSTESKSTSVRRETPVTLADVIVHILDIRTTGEVSAFARWVHGDEASEATVAADPMKAVWALTHASGEVIDDSTRSDIRRPVPLLARLCFPLDLDIWNRSGDNWFIVDAAAVEGGYTVELKHRTSGARSELFYDSDYRLLTRWTGFGGDRLSVLWELSLTAVVRPPPARSGLSVDLPV